MVEAKGEQFGEGLRVPDLFNEMPHVDEMDPEFMFEIFHSAKEFCLREGMELTGWNLLQGAKRMAITDFKQDFINFDHSNGNARWQFLGSLLEPGLEVMRYLPKIAKRLDIDVEREFKPLWEYVEPDFMMRINFGHWNKVSQILDDLPHIAEELKKMDEKPMCYFQNRLTDHGLTARILGEEIQIGIRGNLDEHDVPNALRFSGNLGPKVLFVNDRWIVEEYITQPKAESYDMHGTKEPEVYGNIMGSALRQIHDSGFSYNESLYGNVMIEPSSDKIYVTNWCSAREDGQTETDLLLMKNIFIKKYLNNNQTHSFIQAIKGFSVGYEKGQQIPLHSVIK